MLTTLAHPLLYPELASITCTLVRYGMRKQNTATGFSLLELLLVLGIVVVVVGFAVIQFKGTSDGERLAQSVARRIRERRSAAIKLSPQVVKTANEDYIIPPVTIDFSNLSITAPLKIEAPAGTNITRFNAPPSAGGIGTWTYEYQGSALALPTGWRVVRYDAELGVIPQIALGQTTASIGFDKDGRPDPRPSHDSEPGAGTSENPFWIVYFTNGTEARAIGVHSTGLVEVFRYEDGIWTGFSGRPMAMMETGGIV